MKNTFLNKKTLKFFVLVDFDAKMVNIAVMEFSADANSGIVAFVVIVVVVDVIVIIIIIITISIVAFFINKTHPCTTAVLVLNSGRLSQLL